MLSPSSYTSSHYSLGKIEQEYTYVHRRNHALHNAIGELTGATCLLFFGRRAGQSIYDTTRAELPWPVPGNQAARL